MHNKSEALPHNTLTQKNLLNAIILVVFLIPLNYALYVTLKPSLPVPSVPPVNNTSQQPARPPSTDANWAAYINMGLNFYNNSNYSEAIKAWQKSLEINPKSELALSNIGSAYGKLGDWATQKKYCEMALSVNPNFELAKANLTQAIEELKKQGK